MTKMLRAGRGIVPLWDGPSESSAQVSELLLGEAFTVQREEGRWSYGRSTHDDYPGWVESAALVDGPTPTHRIVALRAFLYPDADFKRRPIMAASLGARVAVESWSGAYGRLAGGRAWIASVALAPLAERAPDWTDTALRFLNVPYLWGGRSSLGIDCSGLVQVALAAAGIPAPRDSGDQRAALGDAAKPLRRGDVVFFPGHVAIMIDPERCVHATSDRMAVVVEPLATVAERLEAREGKGVLAIARPSPPTP